MPTGRPDDPVNVGDEKEDDLVEVEAESDHSNTGGEDATKVPSGRRTRTRGGPHQKRQRTSGAEQQQTTGPNTRAHRETSSEVQTLKKEVAPLRAEQADLHSKLSSVSKQLFERVAALEKARETGNTGGGLGAPGHLDVTSPSKRVDSSPDPVLRDTAASLLAEFARPRGRSTAARPPPPQQSYPPPAIPSMSGAGEGGGEWMRDSGVDAGAAGATCDAFTGGCAKSKYVGVTGGGGETPGLPSS
ncbi:unnamed protein product [Closterium sp. NIES-64]|nr:unnamed protein product [Closterium sp. NIES-64]